MMKNTAIRYCISIEIMCVIWTGEITTRKMLHFGLKFSKNVFRVWSDNSKLSQMPHRENYSVTVVFSVKPSEIVAIIVVIHCEN